MSVRDSMTNLIARLRQMCEAGGSDYSLAGKVYWSDEDLQDMLDTYRKRLTGVALAARPSYENGSNIYLRYELPYLVGNCVEGAGGSTAHFRVYDSTGVTVDPTAYNFNERELSITFEADTKGMAYYWDGYAIDITQAARDVWLAKAAHASKAINFSADGQRFDREALYQHCMEMAKVFGYRDNASKVKASKLLRTDMGGGRV